MFKNLGKSTLLDIMFRQPQSKAEQDTNKHFTLILVNHKALETLMYSGKPW